MNIKFSNDDFFDENENFRAFFTSAHREKTMHSHEFYEISYLYEGHGESHTEKGSKPFRAGEFIFIKPGTNHAVTSPQKKDDVLARLGHCIFTQKYFEGLIEDYSAIFKSENYALYNMLFDKSHFCLHLSDDDAKNIYRQMWIAAHEYNHFKIGSEAIIKNSMLNLLISITRLYECHINNVPPTVSTNKDLDELVKYMRSNFGYNLTLEFLAAQVHLSREHLSRIFKQYTGQTISDFLLDIRITRAKQMLKNPKHSITDISSYCGYQTVGNFQRAFKKATGMSPREYRKSTSAS